MWLLLHGDTHTLIPRNQTAAGKLGRQTKDEPADCLCGDTMKRVNKKVARGTGRDCSWTAESETGGERRRDGVRGGRRVEGVGKNVCVNKNKGEIKRGGRHRQKEG